MVAMVPQQANTSYCLHALISKDDSTQLLLLVNYSTHNFYD